MQWSSSIAWPLTLLPSPDSRYALWGTLSSRTPTHSPCPMQGPTTTSSATCAETLLVSNSHQHNTAAIATRLGRLNQRGAMKLTMILSVRTLLLFSLPDLSLRYLWSVGQLQSPPHSGSGILRASVHLHLVLRERTPTPARPSSLTASMGTLCFSCPQMRAAHTAEGDSVNQSTQAAPRSSPIAAAAPATVNEASTILKSLNVDDKQIARLVLQGVTTRKQLLELPEELLDHILEPSAVTAVMMYIHQQRAAPRQQPFTPQPHNSSFPGMSSHPVAPTVDDSQQRLWERARAKAPPVVPSPVQRPATAPESSSSSSTSSRPTTAASSSSMASSDALLCVVCLTEPKNVMVEPCAHLCICKGCAQLGPLESKCPLCRTHITAFRTVYY